MKSQKEMTTTSSEPVTSESRVPPKPIVTTGTAPVTKHLSVPTTETGTIPKTRQSPSDADQRTSWIYSLNKQQLQEECAKFSLPYEGTVEDLRKILVRFLRSGQPISPTEYPKRTTTAEQTIKWTLPSITIPSAQASKPRSEPVSNTTVTYAHPQSDVHCSNDTHSSIAEKQLDNIKEMLGLPSNTDFESIKRKMDSILHRRPTTESSRVDNVHYSRDEIRKPDVKTSPQWTTSHQRTSSEINIRNPYSTADLCSIVRKWNLKFDGGSNPISFLERLHELIDAYSITTDDIIKVLPELLHGPALLWQRNNRMLWRNFSDFKSDFEMQYLPPDYKKTLTEEIHRRTQGDQESIKQYAVALCTLMRRKGDYTESETVDRIYTNMRPEYKFYVRRTDFNSLRELIRQAENYENYLREKRNFHPPPNPAQSQIPETAYRPKENTSENSKFVYKDRRTSSQSWLRSQTDQRGRPNNTAVVGCEKPEMRNDNDSVNQQKYYDVTKEVRPSDVNYGNHRRGFVNINSRRQGNTEEVTRKPPQGTATQDRQTYNRSYKSHHLSSQQNRVSKPNKTEESTNTRGRVTVGLQGDIIPDYQNRKLNNTVFQCWNCEGGGHGAKECPSPRVLRCFNCKTPGIRTIHCDCRRQGNELRASD